MSTKGSFDWSKYEDNVPESKGAFDWSKYEDQEEKPKKGLLRKAGRVGLQYGLGALQATPAGLAYEAATAAESSKNKQLASYRENLFGDIERLLEQKQMGDWDVQDQELLTNLMEQANDPSKSEQFLRTSDIGIKDIAEKVTGMDLHPEDLAEKAASWSGFIKDPKNFIKGGMGIKEAIKSIAPTGKEALRGLGAGLALQMAEDGEFGPIGTITSAIVGDVAATGISGLGKKAIKAIASPKQTLAKIAAAFTPKDKVNFQKELVKSFRQAGIQADLGTITDNNVIKAMQARLAQSGLVGKSLDDFRKTLSDDIISQYKQIANKVGEARFASSHEAGNAMQETLKRVRDADLSEARTYYNEARSIAKDPNAVVDASNLTHAITELEGNLKPGSFKAAEQKNVLNILEDLKQDLYVNGKPKLARVEDLINNKIALNEVINYEVQGGAKQLLKNIVKEVDKSILRYGKEDPRFARNYINANKKFSEHAKTFRNKRVNQILTAQDPTNLMNKMNTVQGIKDLESALSKSSEGKKLFEDLKRFKLEELFGKSLEDSLTKQVKLGTFSNISSKGKNRELIRSMMSPASANRLERLEKLTGRVADTVQKFYNASKTASAGADLAVMGKAFTDFMHLVGGNPWPLAKTAGTVLTVRSFAKLISDPKFLSMVEDAILAAEKNDLPKLLELMERLRTPMMAALNEERSNLD
tara:strand:- start:4618 stop:6720 length:2103 start_codon:yes stop_codon:yes gene_type:complete